MTDEDIIQQYKKYEPIFGSWYIKRFIGEGGFAKVFEIGRTDFGQEYISALKIITVSKSKSEINTLKSEGMSDEDIREYLHGIVEDTIKEIQLMYKLRSKGNIVNYEDHAVMEHESGMGWDILIKMEYLTSLSTYIRQKNGRLAKRDIIKLGVDICKSLEYCQRYNIIHRDIKADNIFISEEGEFKLGDFGIARVIERKDQTLSKKGTSAYMAPEVYKGQTYTSAVDIYSLGMVMYRLMNNNRGPFMPPYPQSMSLDDRDRGMMMRMSGEKFPVPNQVARGRLVEIVLKACAYRPEERYSSPGFMRQELEAILLDLDEMTTDEWIMIYDSEGKSNSSTFTFSKSSVPAPKGIESVGVTEVLRGEGVTEMLKGEATEVLREDGATEVLREDDGSDSAQSMDSGQEQTKSVNSKNQNNILARLKMLWNSKKPLVIGSVCTVVILLAVIIGVVVFSSSDGDDPASNTLANAEESTESTEDSNESAEESGGDTEQVIRPQEDYDPSGGENVSWTDSILMSDEADYNSGDDNKVFGSDITRKEIVTISFLYSLDTMPEDAWDVSDEKNGKVMAWAVPIDGGYDLYIAAEGGVVANPNCDRMFEFYTNVEKIYLNGSFHTDNTETMFAMFDACVSLTDLNVNDFITSNVTNMSYMFNRCKNLNSIDVSCFDTSNVTHMCAMFNECDLLTDLNVSGFNTANVTDMSYMFNQCKSLSSIDVSGFDTSKVTDMNWMFSECYLLTEVDVSGFDTSEATSMRSMFNNCASLNGVDVSGFDTSNVMDVSYMFCGCISLEKPDLSNFTQTQINQAFLD